MTTKGAKVVTDWDFPKALAVLEKAKELCDRYPDLGSWYAVSLYVIDDHLVPEYADILQHCNIFAGMPKGIDQADFMRMATFFRGIYNFLVPYKVFLTTTDIDIPLEQVRRIVNES